MSLVTVSDRYRFADILIQSEIPLPSLPGGEAASVADIRIARALLAPAAPVAGTEWLHHWPRRGEEAGLSLARAAGAGGGWRLRFHRVCDFLISPDASAITVMPLHHLAEETLEHLLLDQVLPRVLAQRGRMVVHAALVGSGTDAAILLGRSGWGKSTLAGLLHAHGWRLWSDDCTLLHAQDDAVLAWPAYPGLRLFRDSIEVAFGQVRTLPMSAYSEKCRVQLGGCTMPTVPLRLRALYLLNDPLRPETEASLRTLAPSRACMALVEHGFRLDPGATESAQCLLQQAAALLRHVPAMALGYRRDYAERAAVLDLMQSHWEGLLAAGPE